MLSWASAKDSINCEGQRFQVEGRGASGSMACSGNYMEIFLLWAYHLYIVFF